MIVILAFLLIAIFIVTLIYGIFFERKLGASKEIKLLFTLDELKRKVDIINTTADRNEFEKNLSEIKKGLRHLSKHEYLGIFYNSTPSKDFHRLLEAEPEIRNLFELREKELLRDNNEDILPDNILKRKSYKKYEIDLERYAIMCNAYLEHQEEMEQYQK